MKTVQIIRNYDDIELKTLIQIDTIRKVSDDRATALVNAGVAIIIEDPDNTLEYDLTPPLKTPNKIKDIVEKSKKSKKKS